jgi:hypothetical protein
MPLLPVTATGLMTDAFGVLNVFQPGASIPPADAQSALRVLNRLIGQWALQGLTIPAVTQVSVTLVSGKGGPSNPYTIGPTGNIATARPPSQAHVLAAALVSAVTIPATPTSEIPLALYTDQAYLAISVKELAGAQPSGLWYNPTWPLGTIQLWPVPTSTATLPTIVLSLQQPLATFATLTQSYDLPDGMEDAIVTNYALKLATPWGATPPPEIVVAANESLRILKRANLKMTDLGNDFAGGGLYDIQLGNG